MPLTHKGLSLGQPAPTWQLSTTDGRLVKLDHFRGRPLLIFFFRGTWCPHCRKQMEAISQNWEQIRAVANAVGIVGQNKQAIADYNQRTPLPFPLLPDPDRSVIKEYQIYQPFGLNGFRIAHPTTLILDRQGLVQYCYVGQSQFDRPEMPDILKELHKLN